MGHGSHSVLQDETSLGCPDDYNSLSFKTRDICRWAIDETDFDHLLMVDTDCCVFPARLIDYEQYDYMGKFNGGHKNIFNRTLELKLGEPPVFIGGCFSWASGAGYFISRKFAQTIAALQDNVPDYFGYAEDVMVGQYAEIYEVKSAPAKHDYCKYFLKNGASRGYDPNSGWMEKTYAAK